MLMITEKLKLVLAYSLAGIVFAIASTATTSILAGAIGLEFNTTLQGVSATFFNPTDAMSVVFTVITLLILGVYIWIFGYIGGWVKNKISHGGKMKLQKRPHLISLFAMGIVVIGVFALFDQFLLGIDSSGDLTDTSAFIEQIQAFNILSVVVRLIAFAGLGFLVIWLGSKFQVVEKPFPDAMKKF